MHSGARRTPRVLRHAQPEQVLHLAEEHADRDPSGEAGDHRLRHVFHQCAEAQQAGRYQHRPGEQGAQEQRAVAELFDHIEGDRDERGGRTSDLHPRAAEGGDQEARDDGSLEAGVVPEAIASAIASGNATTATVSPAIRS